MTEKYIPLFDLHALEEEMREAKMMSARYESMLTFRVNSLRELCGRLPSSGEIFFIATKKSFSAFTFIAYLIRTAGKILNLFIATYSTNDRIIGALLKWKSKGMLLHIHIHISETIKFRMPKVWERLVELEREGTIRLSTAWSHKKITCMETEEGHYVVEGSGNYGENALEEQYIFLKNKEVYEFRSKC